MNNNDLEAVYGLYCRPLTLYALSLTGNWHDAQDLTADTFVKALMSYEGENGSIFRWLTAVMKHLFIDDFRKKKKYVADSGEVLEWLESSQNVLDDYIRDEKKQWIYKEIYKLPKAEREVMILTAAGRLNDSEIAELMRMTISNVRVIRHRARKKLTELAKKEGYL